MNKILIISVLAVVLLSISVASISAQSKYDIPAWVKGVAGFWSEGKITDDEFGDGLSFLINNNIITVPKIKQLQDENTKLKNDIDKLESENTQPIQNTPAEEGKRCLAPPKSNIDLRGCNLTGADLSGADLTHANLSGADFTNADLSGANLNGVYFGGGTAVQNEKYTNFNGANLSGITYVGCIGSPIGTPSTGALPICMLAP